MTAPHARQWTVFRDGWVFTGDSRQPHWGSLVVRGGTIHSLDAAEATRQTAAGADVIDLGGRLLMAGFQDAHVHPVMAGIELLGCDLSSSRDAGESLAAIAAYAQAHPELPWITGAGWAMDWFAHGTPTRQMLDAVVPDRPVLLENRDHHSAWANSRAFEIAGVGALTPDPADGRFEREADGRPAGTVHDGAMSVFDGVRPPVDADLAFAALLAAQTRLLSFGVTAWQDAAVGALMGQPDTVEVYARALEANELRVRVRGAQWWERAGDLTQVEALSARAHEIRERYAPERFSLGAVKMMVDGVAESGTAAMHGHYRDAEGADTDSRGITFFDPADLMAFVAALDTAGLQIHFHTLGDRAVTDALDALDFARARNGATGLRHHLAHLEVVRAADIPRFAPLDVTANLQPVWAAHDDQLDNLVLPFLPSRARSMLYPFASLAAEGVRLALGSDWPVSSPDPIHALHVGVNRRHVGASAAPLLPEQALDLPRLLRAATVGSAYVNHLDAVCGRLRPGMFADLVVLDRNLWDLDPTELHTARVDETWIEGARVYARA